MAVRGLRRKKPTELKIAVVGAAQVGKSALVVRFLTKRYIGEYGQSEHRYKHETKIDGDDLIFEILDSASKPGEVVFNPSEILQYADGIMLVYSITHNDTFNYIRRAKSELQLEIPLCLVANKVDMVHLRRVGREQGEDLAKDLKCKYSEVSAAEQFDQVAAVFTDFLKDVAASKRKSKTSLLDRVLRSRKDAPRPYNRGKSDSSLL